MIGRTIVFKTADEATSFTFNQRYSQPLLWAQSPFYYIALTSVDGLFGADLSIESHPIPNFIGEISGDIFRRGKTVTLSGTIQAMNLSTLEQGANYLQQMCADRGLRKIIWNRWEDNIQVYLKVRINQDLAISQAISDNSYRYNWTFAIRADDPRTYAISDDTVYPAWQE